MYVQKEGTNGRKGTHGREGTEEGGKERGRGKRMTGIKERKDSKEGRSDRKD
jgi:hypothetical protein